VRGLPKGFFEGFPEKKQAELTGGFASELVDIGFFPARDGIKALRGVFLCLETAPRINILPRRFF